MKDKKHHLKHVLKKVIREARQNPEVKEYLDKSQALDTEDVTEESREVEETFRWYGKRRLPRRKNTPTYH